MRTTIRHTAATALVLIAALLTSCQNHNEAGNYTSFGPAGWAYGDTVSLAPIDSALVTADLVVVIRNSNQYEFSNIWVETTYCDADSVRRDTSDIRLADVYGQWLGTGVGVGFQRADTIARDIKIDLAQPVTLRHIMRTDTLAGIEQAGLIVIKK